MKLAAALLLALRALAQEAPEIRGTVIEYGPNTGIAGVFDPRQGDLNTTGGQLIRVAVGETENIEVEP